MRFRFPPALNYGDPSDSPTELISDLDMKKMLEKKLKKKVEKMLPDWKFLP